MGNDKISQKSVIYNGPVFLSLFFTLIYSIPVMASFGLFSGSSMIDSVSIVSRSERLLFAGFFILFINFLFTKNIELSRETNEYPAKDNKTNIYNSILIFLPALPFLIRNAFYTYEVYAGLIVGDFDYTNISQALNLTTRGEGLLPAPHVSTGITGSFLGHHFSPSLLLFVPFYGITRYLQPFFAFRATHLLYGLLLYLSLFWGILLWTSFIKQYSSSIRSAILASAMLFNSILLWRIAGSFHFEILVIPFSALLFIRFHRKDFLFWVILILWLGLKEDMAIYAILAGVYWFTVSKEMFYYERSFRVILFSAIYFIFAMWMKSVFSGGAGPDWTDYWFRYDYESPSLYSLMIPLISMGLFPLYSLKVSLILLFPLLLIHFTSSHPWHSSFIAHYGYTILPFLMLGTVHGIRIITSNSIFMKRSTALISLGFAMSFYTATGEKGSPYVRVKQSPRYEFVENSLMKIPGDSCSLAQVNLSPHMPLDVKVFPIYQPRNNPVTEEVLSDFFYEDGKKGAYSCENYYLFMDDGDAMIPYYSKEDLRRFSVYAGRNMKEVERKGNLVLYGPLRNESEKTD